MSEIVRKGICSACNTRITLEINTTELDRCRFYFNNQINCPMCTLPVTTDLEVN